MHQRIISIMDNANCRDESSSSTIGSATSWFNTNSTCSSSWPNNIWHTLQNSYSTYQPHHLSADSSRGSSDDFIVQHASHNHNPLSWTQVLSQNGSDGDLRNNIGETEEKFVNSKSSIFEPVCDYLKMLDNNNWEHTNSPPSFNSTFETESLKKYDNINNYKNETRMIKCYGQETESAHVYYNEFMIPECISTVPDIMDASIRSTKQLMEIHAPNNCFKTFVSSDCKTTVAANLAMKISGRGQGISNQAKKKKCEETRHSDVVSKRSKHNEGSILVVSPPKVQNVKLGDRISALQQIVSPFGKTDRASVLMEAIGYINFLQEQVQLLTNPYMKTCNSHKEAWGGMDRKVVNMLGDLKSKGLCLVPISSTPQACHDNTGAEYWSPTYRGCLYR